MKMKILPLLMVIVTNIPKNDGAGYPNCGREASLRPKDAAFVAGQTTKTNKQPWAVAIVYDKYQNETWTIHCSGSLISPRLVLSASHCFDPKKAAIEGRKFIRPDELILAFNVNDLRDLKLPKRNFVKIEMRSVKKVHRYPTFDYPAAYNDIAVIELNDTVTLKKDVSPVCLPEPSSDKNQFKGYSTTVVGYGQKEDGSTTVKEAQQKVKDHNVCVARFLLKNTDVKYNDKVTSVFPNQFNGSLLCAGHRTRLGGTCPGDSGSPLLNDEQSPDTLEIITTQIGVLHGGFVPCSDRDYPGIYALLTEPNMNKWLLDIVTENRPPTTCLEFPCQNGGACELDDKTEEYNCKCNSFYIGDKCQNPIVCQESPCLNGGTCKVNTTKPWKIVCKCPTGFRGKYCQTSNVMTKCPNTSSPSTVTELIPDKKNQAISCPLEIENTRIIEGKCIYYMKLAKEVVPAERHCQVIFGPDSSGRLYEPSSKAEHNKVVEEAEKIYSGIKDAYMFIGLYDKDGDDVYRYISSGSLNYFYDLWDKDQPNGDPHVVTQAKKNGKWSSVYGTVYKFYSVCEKI